MLSFLTGILLIPSIVEGAAMLANAANAFGIFNGIVSTIFGGIGLFHKSESSESQLLKQILEELKNQRPKEAAEIMTQHFPNGVSACGMVKTPNETVVHVLRVNGQFLRRFGELSYDYETKEVTIKMLTEEIVEQPAAVAQAGGIGSILSIRTIDTSQFRIITDTSRPALSPLQCDFFADYEKAAELVMRYIKEQRIGCRITSNPWLYFSPPVLILEEYYLMRERDALHVARWVKVVVKNLTPHSLVPNYRVKLAVQANGYLGPEEYVFTLKENRYLVRESRACQPLSQSLCFVG